MASKTASSFLPALLKPSRALRSLSSTPTLRLAIASRPSPSFLPQRALPATHYPLSSRRFAHSIPRPPQRQQSPSSSDIKAPPKAPLRAQQPSYELTFTCVPCGHRSAHNVSKQGYHHGSVLITCPSCRNRHVISDHLNIFGNRSVTVEDLMRERGRLVKRGTLGEDGDIEFWEDGTTTVRQERHETDPAPAPRSEAAADGGTAPGASWSSSGKKLE